MNEAIGFDELRWLQELAHRVSPKPLPATMGARLLMRGLVEETAGRFRLTARGRIALSKLG